MRRSVSGAIAIAVVLATVGGAIALDPFPVSPPSTEGPDPDRVTLPDADDDDGSAAAGLVQFESAAAFEEYVRESRDGMRLYLSTAGGSRTVEQSAEAATQTPPQEAGGDDAGGDGGGAGDARVSDTNVQEVGIDEPDVLKTRGSTVFYAKNKRYGGHGEDVTILDASDPAAPAPVGEIDETGRMLIAGDHLVIFGRDEIHGYDVSSPAEPEKQWERDLDARIQAARLLNGSIFLVLRESVDLDDPCPVEPMEGVAQECTDVYHPERPTDVEATYTTVSIDPDSGDVGDAVSVVGSRQYTATYVSENGVYLTYATSASRANLTMDFLLEQDDLLDDRALERLRELQTYDLSAEATLTEIRVIVRDWLARVDEDEREDLRETLDERRTAYFEERKRDLVETGIVRIDVDEGDLAVGAVGSVPGRPLNQFSMDEYEGRLRIATTVAGFGTESENDLYVLDGDLSVVGAVQGMGLDERIYSVRFMDEEAYVVTFRRIDPFHVVDLSNPADPTVQGELKLPGFSSYLHPVAEDRIMGIGEEDGQVKVVLFDVSTPTDPTVADATVLNDRWSAISRTHHAFLQDRKHGIVFIPGREGGYVFGYEDGLDRVATIETEDPARRAMYVGDYLYVFAGDELVVVDETDWSRETTVAL
ncbi:MAG: inhibitor of cysteine peptidase [Halobacteriales archaeon]|jgi:inhibitor of cysteine peptidase